MPRDDTPEQALRAASWQRVRDDFERLASKPHVSLVALVTEGDADPSAFLRELAARENRAHWQGTVIRPVDGQPGEYEPVPDSHRLFGFGEPETWEAFRVAAMRAGVLAKAVPEHLLPASVRDRMGDLDRWAWALFEIGWRRLDTVPFRAERWVRDDGGAVQLELARSTGLYRGWYYSEIGDAVSASIDVVDVLRTMERAGGTPSGDLLQDVVAALLRRIPERWAEYDADALTATESQALFLLVAAGMVERRIRLRARLHNHPVAVEATITATGEYGFVEAMEPVLATMWAEWKDAYHAWRTGETRGAPFSINEHLKPDEWRLTDQGALARADLDGDSPHVALDFVLRRGFFDGQPGLILEPGRERVSQRGAVRGYGRLVTMRKVQADASPPAVNIGNWKEGADAFAAAFEARAKANGDDSSKLPDKPQAVREPPKPTTKRDERTKWLAEAMLLVRDHPDWSDSQIAERVGKHRSTLTRSREYQAAAALARGRKDQLAQGFIEKDPDTGRTDVEAYADEDDFDS